MIILGSLKAKEPIVPVTDSLLLHFNGVDEATVQGVGAWVGAA